MTKKDGKQIIRWVAAFAAVSLVRVILGALLGVWFDPTQECDDALLILYSVFPTYFSSMAPNMVLLKELGQPVFYQLVNFSGISYPVAISFLWLIAGGLTARFAYLLTGNRRLTFAVYTGTTFVPAAFDMELGTRLYRAGLQNPVYIILFALAMILLYRIAHVQDEIRGKKLIGLSLILGLVFTFAYYVKEDGAWLFAVLLAFSLLFVTGGVVRLVPLLRGKAPEVKKTLATLIAAVLIPFALFGTVTLAYKAVNYRFFGVFETNTRTAGESGKFVENIYKIASDDRTGVVWAPKDAIEQAFEVSPTLASHPELKEEIYHSDWLQGGIDETPLHGDFLTWVLKDAVFTSGVLATQAEKEAFFKQVNAELDAAFRDGRLQKEGKRVTILSSLGGVTGEEFGEAASNAFKMYGYHIFLNGYEFGGRYMTPDDPNGSAEAAEISELASVIVNYDVSPLESEAAVKARELELNVTRPVVNALFWLARILNPALLLLALAGIVFECIRFLKSKKKREELSRFLAMLSALGLLAVSFVYNYVIALFCREFREPFPEAEKMYSVGTVSLLVLFTVIGVSLFIRNFPFIRTGKRVSRRAATASTAAAADAGNGSDSKEG